MTYCEHCGVEIGYLPFKCKYCGGTFCKKHRLPENHQCTFELKHTPVVPSSSREYSARTIIEPVSQK
ncbi:MAG: AN1-type zinc finger domain-containing protein, partial [Promethearchaeota archaeon]